MADDLLNNSDDFIEGKKNLKKPLIYGAIGFLVFVIGVIVFALFQNSSSKKNEIVPPEPKKKKITIESQFKPLMIEENETQQKPVVETKQNKPQEQVNEIKPQIMQEPQIQEEVKVQKPIQKPEVKPIEKESIKKEPIKESKEEIKKASKGKYYIQVAALLRHSKPDKRFLEHIKKEGFEYKLYHTYIVKNNEKIKVTKILVGPFATKKEAKDALKKVKATISKTAFIFKVK